MCDKLTNKYKEIGKQKHVCFPEIQGDLKWEINL